MACETCRNMVNRPIRTGLGIFGLQQAGCFCGPDPTVGLEMGDFPGDISRLERDSTVAAGWFLFSVNLQLNAVNQTVVDFKLVANCFSAELLDFVGFTGDNPGIILLVDRVRVLIYPQAGPIDPLLFSTVRRSLFLQISAPTGIYTQSLYMNTGTGFSGGAVSTGTGTATDLAREYSDIMDDRIKPTMLELGTFGDVSDRIVSRQNAGTAAAYRFDVLLHGTAFGGLNASLRERGGECHPTKIEAVRQWAAFRGMDSQGLAGGGYQLPPSVTG